MFSVLQKVQLPRKSPVFVAWLLLGAGLLFLGLLLLLSGPGFRILAPRLVDAIGESRGFTASLRITGSLLGGFSIHEVAVDRRPGRKDFPVESLRIGEFSPGIDRWELLRRPADLLWLKSLSLHEVDAVLDLPNPASPSTGDAAQGKEPGSGRFSPWNLRHVNADLSRFDLRIRKSGRETVVRNAALKYRGARGGELLASELVLPGQPAIRDLRIPLSPRGTGLRLEAALPELGLALPEVELKPSPDGGLSLSALVEAGNGTVRVSFDGGEGITCRLENEQHLDLNTLPVLAGLEPRVGGKITALDLRLSGPLRQPALWKVDGLAEVEKPRYDRFALDSATLRLDGESIGLEAARPGMELDLTGTIPLSEAPSLADLKKLAPVLSGEVSLSSVSRVMKDLEIDTPISGATRLTLDQVAFRIAPGPGPGVSGNLTVSLKNFRFAGGHPVNGELLLRGDGSEIRVPEIDLSCGDVSLGGNLRWEDGELRIDALTLSRDGVPRLEAKGSLPLSFPPASIPEDEAIEFSATAADLAPIDLTRFFRETSPLAGSLAGTLEAEGPLHRIESRADVRFVPELGSGETSPGIRLALDFLGDVLVPRSWEARADATVDGVRYGETSVEDLRVHLATEGTGQDKAIVARLELDQSGATLRAGGRFDLADAATLRDLGSMPLRCDARLDIPELEPLRRDFPWKGWKDIPLTGSLQGRLEEVVWRETSLESGRVTLRSDALAIGGEILETFRILGTVDRPGRIDADLEIALDAESRLRGDLFYRLKDRGYGGELGLRANPGADGKLKRLLKNRNLAALIPGKTELDWRGEGSIGGRTHRGDLVLAAERFLLAEGAEPIDLRLVGNYTDHSAEFPDFSIRSRPLELQGSLKWDGSRIDLTGLRGSSGGREILTGFARFPLEPGKLAPEIWFARNVPVELELTLDDAPVESLSRLFLREPPISAMVDADLQASGAVANPRFDLVLSAGEIGVPGTGKGKLPMGKLDLEISARDAMARLEGSFRHPDIEPFRLSGSLPFSPGDWATGRRRFNRERIRLEAKMEESSLAFLSTQVPGVERVEGSVSVDARVEGTVARPTLIGSGWIDLERLTFEDRNAPDINRMETLISFRDHRIRLEKLVAIVAGGTLEGKGTADLKPGKEPMLDFSIRGSEVLVARTPEVNLRTDADLRISGPVSRASITGELGITGSRFFKNIDLLPARFPARPGPRLPKTPRDRTGPPARDLDFGIRQEPFANWTSDVRIFTKDPFLIRGNIAHSEVTGDLRISGPLSRPVPLGSVSLAEGDITLPFSTISVELGRIDFDEKTRFNGAIEFKARSRVDDHRITIYVHDRILTPKTVMTSVPSLPSEDIISLLATGTTRNDWLDEDAGEMAASRAASLLIKSLRRNRAEAERRPGFFDDLRDRTELELGAADPKTGIQSFGGKIRLWKQLFFVGDVDRENDYRALLKVIFSFR